jgi:ABC-type dipeptide/oligopeptide/nickel transport system permease component
MLTRYVVRRLLLAVVQLAGITLLVFFLIRLLPADPVGRLVGLNATPEAIAHARASLDLDKSIPRQLAIYLGLDSEAEGSGVLRGDLGSSWVTGSPVAEEIGKFLPVTVELITSSFLLAVLVGVPVGIVAALRQRGLVDRAAFTYSLFAGAQPEFWWGLMFVFLFFSEWGLAPAPLGRLAPLTSPPDTVTGFLTLDALLAGRGSVFVEALYHLMLPVLTLAFVLSGPIIKMVRQSMLAALGSDYILYARSCGLSPFRVAMYTFRNAFAPSLTLIGILYGYMLGGAVLIEQVFSFGGLGQYALRSILSLDYPAIQGVILVITAGSLLTLLAIDVIHALVDPRVAQ